MRLGVPLHVWDVSRPATGAAADLPPPAVERAGARPHWPEAVRITDLSSLLSAFRGVEKELSSQRIVWLHGRLNPAKVELTAGAAPGVALVP